MKIQKAIWQETRNIALGVVALSAVMQAVFFLIGKWDMTVLWGNLLGGVYAVLNFFILGLTVQKVAADADEKRGKNLMQFSYSTRMFFTMVVVFLGISVPLFHWVAVFAPQLFPRITIFFMGVKGQHAKEAAREMSQKHTAIPSADAELDEEDDLDAAVAQAQAEAAAAKAAAAEAEAKAALARAEAAEAQAKAAEAQAKAAKK